eukprot:UN12757
MHLEGVAASHSYSFTLLFFVSHNISDFCVPNNPANCQMHWQGLQFSHSHCWPFCLHKHFFRLDVLRDCK